MNQIKRLIMVSLGLTTVMFGMHAAQEEIESMQGLLQVFQQVQQELENNNFVQVVNQMQQAIPLEDELGRRALFGNGDQFLPLFLDRVEELVDDVQELVRDNLDNQVPQNLQNQIQQLQVQTDELQSRVRALINNIRR